jgi:hypothetical protein
MENSLKDYLKKKEKKKKKQDEICAFGNSSVNIILLL